MLVYPSSSELAWALLYQRSVDWVLRKLKSWYKVVFSPCLFCSFSLFFFSAVGLQFFYSTFGPFLLETETHASKERNEHIGERGGGVLKNRCLLTVVLVATLVIFCPDISREG